MMNDKEFNKMLSIKTNAHMNYIMDRLEDTAQKQTFDSFTTILLWIESIDFVAHPDNLLTISFNVIDAKTHKKVIDTYKEIFYTVYNQYSEKQTGFYEIQKL